MQQPFGPDYASAYDDLYRDKDYPGECDLLEQAFSRFAEGAVESVLDMGCGTGEHALRLAQRGYRVLGVDRSPAMLARAREKVRALQDAAPEFVLGELPDLELGRIFDAATLMFAVLGYMQTNAQVLGALRAAAAHLRPGGVLVGDVWYGPAVLGSQPRQRVKLCEVPGGQLIRTTRPCLDPREHACTITFDTWRLEGEQVRSESHEEHRVRFFFPLELERFLEDAGLRLASLSAFPTLDGALGPESWSAVFAATRSGAASP